MNKALEATGALGAEGLIEVVMARLGPTVCRTVRRLVSQKA